MFSAGRNTGLSRVAAAGGTPEPLTKPDASRGDTSHRWPYFLPDGRHLRLLRDAERGPKSALFYASVDGKENRLLLEDASNAEFCPGAPPVRAASASCSRSRSIPTGAA